MFHHLIPYLKAEGCKWVVAQREAHRPMGRPLNDEERGLRCAFFQSSTLEAVRLREVEEIDNPPFYKELDSRGIPPPFDFHLAAGITFIDTVLIAPPAIVFDDVISIVFHECVHVVQYEMRGVDGFIADYIAGWASVEFDYFRIPLEMQADRLQFLFDRHRHLPFSVEEAVAVHLRQGNS